MASVLGGFSASVSETHHVHKKDAPSGTAKRLRSIIAENKKAAPDEIKVESHRIGEVVGDHTVVFDGKEERIEITHHAKSRSVFARGAVIAAHFAAGARAGLYGMDEVLGIKD
jgi:4-hydroxy-tetrahydrodipicolinate reductase